MKNLLLTKLLRVKRQGIQAFAVIPVVLFLSLFFTENASASHAAGADITYKWVGPGECYQVTYTFYRDCAGVAQPSSVSLRYSSASCGYANNVTLNAVGGTGQEISISCSATSCSTGNQPGFRQWVYRGTVCLPFQCTDWIFSYGIAARNVAISTINNPGNTDLYVEAKLNNVNASHNSSPQFSNYPVAFICACQSSTYNSGALEPDGDSVSYVLVPARSASGTNVGYNGVSGTNPLNPSGSVTLNPVTGDLVINTCVTQVGVIAVQVNEWRLVNGVMTIVGSVIRDMQIYIIPCTNALPLETGMGGSNKRDTTICIGTPLSFIITGSDPDAGQVVTMSWNNGIPAPATFNISFNGSITPQGTFSWTPLVPGTYQFTVTLIDDHCPTKGTQTYSYTIYVNTSAQIAATPPSVCLGASVTVTASGLASYLWNTGGTTSSISVGVLPTGTTSYTVSGTDANGCTGSKVITATVNALPSILVGSPSVCIGLTTPISVSGGTSYAWSPATGLSATTGSPIFNGTGTTTYTVVGTNAAGCTSATTTTVTVNPLPTITASAPGTYCSGSTTALTAGGASTYVWSPATWLSPTTGSSVNITPFSAGTTTATYTVTGTSASGCVGTTTVTITVVPTPIINVSPVIDLCVGQSGTLTASGASSYVWSPATWLSPTTGSSVTVTPSTTGSTIYTVTGSTNGCASSSALTMATGNALPTISASSKSGCVGVATTLTAGGTSSSYTWSNGFPGTSAPLTPLSSGITTYTVTGTGALGCTVSTTVTFTANPLPVINSSPASTCNGANATLTASGATDYVWSPAPTLSPTTGPSVVSSATTSTTYTITGTDANGCINTKTVALTINPLPTVTINSAAAICNGGSSTLTANGATTYSWWNNAASTQTLSVSPTATTTYTVTGTSLGCIGTATVTVTVNPLPVVGASAPASSCSGGATNLTATGATTYTWSDPAGVVGAGSPVTVYPTATTTYTVTGTSSGCSGTATVTVSTLPLPTITASNNPSGCSGQPVTVTAAGGTSYTWNPATYLSPSTGSPVTFTNTNTTSGNINYTYTVTGTGVNGCTNTATVTVTSKPYGSFTVNAPVICTGGSGTMVVTLNGVSGSKYSWFGPSSSGSVSLSGTTSNTYTISPTPTASTTYTFSNYIAGTGCLASNVTLNVTVAAAPTVTISPSATAFCNGQTVKLTASGAVTYLWAPGGQNTSTITGLSSTATTTYTVTGTIPGGCPTSSATITISPNNNNPAVTIVPSTACKDNAFTVGANITVAGNGGPYTYSWGTAPNIASSVTGATATTIIFPTGGNKTINVTITDALGCTAFISQNVFVNTPGTFTVNSPTTCSGTSVVLTASGGGSYLWSPSGGLSSSTGSPVTVVTPSAGTTYTVSGTDVNGCTAVAGTSTVSINPLPTITASAGATVCSGGNVTLTAAGGNSYVWSPATALSATTGASVTSTATTTITYTVTGTGGNGCTNTTTVTVSPSALPTITVSAPSGLCDAVSTITLTSGGGNTYVWNAPASGGLNSTIGSSVTANPTATTTYTVTGTDANGCSNTNTVQVTVNTPPTVNAAAPASICSGANGVLTASGTATSYLWSPGGSPSATPTITPTATTIYTVTGTGAGGCTTTATVNVVVNPVPTVNISAPGTCAGTAATLTAGGATSYVWSTSCPGSLASTTGSSVSTTVFPASTTTTSCTYSVTGTSGGCSSTVSATLNVNGLPAPSAGASPNNYCSGNSATLTATGGTSYVWSGNSTAANAALSSSTGSPVTHTSTLSTTGNVTYTYTITATDANGCSGTTTTSVIVKPTPLLQATPDQTICLGNSATLTAGGINAVGSPFTGLRFSWTPSSPQYTCITTVGSPTCGPTVNPTVTTTYTVVNYFSNACLAADTVYVTVNVTPVGVSAASLTNCSGAGVTLTATGGSGYIWTTPTGTAAGTTLTVNPTVTTTYTVNGSSCDPATVTVTVPSVSATPASICQGSSVILSASGGVSYSWIPDNSNLSGYTGSVTIATPPVTITYSVIITDGSGCTTVLPVTVTVNSPVVTPIIVTNPTADTLHFTPTPGYTYQWYADCTTLIPGQTDTFFVVTQNGVYCVKVTNTVSGCTVILVGPPTTLPIELLDFNAYGTSSLVTLLWTTATETNNDYFTVEKSKEGETFLELRKIPGAGNSSTTRSYRTFDDHPHFPVSYYRLKQTDYDGKYSYSKTVAIDFNHSKNDVLNLFPNPTTSSIEYDYYSSSDATVIIQLSDFAGRVVKSVSINVLKGRNHLSSEMGGLASGIYQLHFSCIDTDFSLVKKVVKY